MTSTDPGAMKSVKRRVWFHRISAIIWMLLLIPAYFFWRDSVLFVIFASVYANVKSDWSASEAADDRRLLDRLDEIEACIREERPGS